MKHFLFIMADSNRENIIVGYCQDAKKMLKFFSGLPSTSLDPEKKACNLVYIADAPNKDTAEHHFKLISAMTRPEKIEIIESMNPEWISFVPDVNIQL